MLIQMVYRLIQCTFDWS